MNIPVSLDGVWRFGFRPIPLEQASPKNIPADSFMTVPGCFDVRPPLFSRRGTGMYVREVECGGGKVRLKIAAMGLRGQVFWDGKKIGTPMEHPFSPEERIFDAGRPGVHTLAVAVENIVHPREEGKLYAADYDFYGHGGIYDSVTLTELSEYWPERIQVTPLDLKGNVRIKLVAAGKLPPKYPVSFRFDQGPVRRKNLSGPVCEWTARVPSPECWSPESPALHELTVDCAGTVMKTSFGIRTLKIAGGRLLLNGKPLRIAGYNRHDSHPDFGYALPEPVMLRDLLMIKGQGMNLIRGCHYPQREKFLDLCDRIGLLVWEEVIGWGNDPVQYRNKDFIRFQLEQAEAMVHKSANHPSVIMWGFLNEVQMPKGNSPRPLMTKLTDLLHREDPSRPTVFAFATGWKDQTDDTCLDLPDILAFNTYPGWYSSFEKVSGLDDVAPTLKKLAGYASSPQLKDKPLIIGEIGGAAIPGDHSGARWSEEYQADLLIRAFRAVFGDPRWSGILVWQFCNCRTYIETPGLLTRPRGFNNKGVLDEYREPKMSWDAITRFLAKHKFDGYF